VRLTRSAEINLEVPHNHVKADRSTEQADALLDNSL